MEKLPIKEYIRKNYIHKDKIREKIKEIENSEENYTFYKLTSKDIRTTIITNLNKLLEETEDENNNTFTMQKQEEQSTDFN